MNANTPPVNNTQLADDLKFLLSFAPATSPEQVVPGLFPTAYLTLSYEGDLEIVKRITEIMHRYEITDKEIDDAPDG